MPATNPNLVGRLEQKQDNSPTVRPESKSAQPRLYRNATGVFVGTPPAGERPHWGNYGAGVPRTASSRLYHSSRVSST